jgi:hypothetical protein
VSILERKSSTYDIARDADAQEHRATRLRLVSVLHQPVLTDKARADITARLKDCAEQMAQRLGRKAAANV